MSSISLIHSVTKSSPSQLSLEGITAAIVWNVWHACVSSPRGTNTHQLFRSHMNKVYRIVYLL